MFWLGIIRIYVEVVIYIMLGKREETKVSVIVPVYNSEKYLRKCFDSLLEQIYKNMEVIAVNDGSTDKSLDIMNEYKNNYPEIFQVYSQKNQGQSSARNFALQYAKGKYVTFLDSDDYILADYLDVLVNAAEKYHSDMVASGEIRIDENGKIVSEIKYKVDKNGNCVLRRLNFSGKLYKRNFLEKHSMKFAVGKVYEDNPFNIEAYALAKNLKILEYIGYYQVVHIGSTTTKKIDSEKLPFKEIEMVIQYVKKNESDVSDNDLFEYTTISFFTYFLFKANKQHYYFDIDGRKSNEELVYEICDYIEEIIKKYFPTFEENSYLRLMGNYGVSIVQSVGVWFFYKLIKYGKMKKFAKYYFHY